MSTAPARPRAAVLEESLPRVSGGSRRGRGWLTLGLLGGVVSCTQPAATPSGKTPAPKTPLAEPEAVLVELNGFNYTDLYIDSFEVNGQSGGNLFVSSPTSGGGGSVCCLRWVPGGSLPLHVSWTRDRKRWCEQEVTLAPPRTGTPHHLGVHFFPDGHIEAELTSDSPALKLELEQNNPEERKASGNTHNDERLSRCKNGT